MSKFKVLGAELEYEFMDADLLEKYQEENQKVIDGVNGIDYTNLSTPAALREQCKIIDAFFDSLFGAGTAEKLFCGKNNIKLHMEAFAAVTDAAIESDKPLKQLTGQYSPNRAQRRAEAKNGSNGHGNIVQIQGAASHKNKNRNRRNGNRA